MNKGRNCRALALVMCLGLCALAQVQGQVSEHRLPGEAPPPFALKWGSTGGGDGQFSAPLGVAMDTSGNVYVADQYNHRIQKFGSDGTFIIKWGSFGSGEGLLYNPAGVAIDAAGNVYVAESGYHRIQQFDSSGSFVRMRGWGVDTGASAFETCTSGCQAGISGSGDGQFDSPRGLAFDAAGNLYVADSLNDRIQKFDGSGTFLTKWGTTGTGDGQFDSPYGVEVDVAGNVHVVERNNHRIQELDSSGNLLRMWGWGVDTGAGAFEICTSGCQAGDFGDGDGQFSTPGGVAVDASGNVYVADSGSDRIQKFSSSRTFMNKWGTDGSADGQFWAPGGLTVDASGNVYVADTYNDRIQKFGPPYDTLVFITKWGSNGTGDGQFDSPWGAAVDASGNVYVVDSLNDRVQKFDSSGRFITEWGSAGSGDGEFTTAFGVATDSSGHVYVSDYAADRIQKFDSSGTFVTKWGSVGSSDGEFISPYGLELDASGNVYVGDGGNNRIQKFDSSGAFLDKWGSAGTGDGEFSLPVDVAVDASGSVYVLDHGNSRVQKFDSDGTFITEWGAFGNADGQFNTPYALDTDASSNVYVADTWNKRIQKFDSTGTFLAKWGTAGTGDGHFDFPAGLAVDAVGNVYVADYYDDRVQKFGPCGFTMTPFSLFFTPGAGSSSFNLDAVAEPCGWTATSGYSWIVVTSGTGGTQRGLGDGSVDFSVEANPTALSRGGYIHISDETTGGLGVAFSVIQDPAPCTYGLSSSSASFSGTAGADFVSVTSPFGCSWTAVSNDGWISVDAGSPGYASGVVLYSITANPGSAARSGTMTIAGHTFIVNQDPQIPDAPSGLACAAAGSTKVGLTWDDNATNEAWIRIERKLGASGTFARILTVPADSTGAQDSTVQRSTTYVYRVMACNSAGCSAPSAEVTETTPALGVFIGEGVDQS